MTELHKVTLIDPDTSMVQVPPPDESETPLEESHHGRPNYIICLASTYPDEPGSGASDNDAYYEHEYYGSRAGAEEEASRLLRQSSGDLHCWIVDNDNKQPPANVTR